MRALPCLSLALAAPILVAAGAGRAQDALVLDTITVTGGFEEARGPFEGWLAGLTATATKTGTPLLEVPQSVSVIGQAEMEARGVTRLNEAFRYTPGVAAELDGMNLSVSNLLDETYVASCGSIWTCGYGYGRTVQLGLRVPF